MAPATTQTSPTRTCRPTTLRKIGDVDGIGIPATTVVSSGVTALLPQRTAVERPRRPIPLRLRSKPGRSRNLLWRPCREREGPGGGAEDPDQRSDAAQAAKTGRRTAKLATPHARHSTQLQAKATK